MARNGMAAGDDAMNAELSEVRHALDAAHRHLLGIHKALIDHERARYERAHGAVGGPVDLLHVLIHNPFFAWLRPMSALIVQIDEFAWSKDPPDPAAGRALLAEAKRLLTPDESAGAGEFAREY